MKTKRKYKSKHKKRRATRKTKRGGFFWNRCTLKHLVENNDAYLKTCCNKKYRPFRTPYRQERCAIANHVDEKTRLTRLDGQVKKEISSQKDKPNKEQKAYKTLRGDAFEKTDENNEETPSSSIDFEKFKKFASAKKETI